MAGPGYPQNPMGPGGPMGGGMGGPPMGGGMGGPPMGGGMGGPPMGGPPMGGPQMMGGPPMMRPPVRRGTPKIVPIIMSAGLAVGVFCGLLFGVGKKSEAAAEPSKGNNVKAVEEGKPDPGSAPAGLGATAAKPIAPAQGSAAKPTATVAAGSGAPTAAGSAAPPVVEDKKIKLTVTLKLANGPIPEAAMKDAKMYIDGKEVEGLTVELPADKVSVKVEVKTPGYRSVEQNVQLKGADVSVEFETTKRSSGTPGVKPPKRPDRPPSGGGGLIDI